MLEKMGWTSGVGLGKKEDGRTEHIDMKFKANLKGVGFVNGKYDDTWVTHSQSFDSVLQQLQQSHPSSNNNTLNDFNQSVRQTKTRFTYKKQSSGKDLSLRSHNELDCIFGWNKSVQNNQQMDLDQDNEESEIVSDNLYTTSKQSINDYFKQKSSKKHQRSQSSNTKQIDEEQEAEDLSSEQVPTDDSANEIVDEPIPKKSKKKKRDTQSSTEESIDDLDSIDNAKKKQKKSNQSDLEDIYPGSNLFDLTGYEGWNIDSSLSEILKKKKNKENEKNKIGYLI